jgi:NAD(P)-dependent dehydrogenase (short-subunit alcohol dehydrogenase family)
MVSIKAIREANKDIASKSPRVIFVGATSGIGLAAIQALLKSTVSPRIFIVGRSEAKFAPTLNELQKLNSSAKLTYIEAQVSLLKDVSRVCAMIEAQESSIDILWLSQGGCPSLDTS